MSEHHCHWPGCETPVPPRMWGCRKHWVRLPVRLRDAVWAAYVPGQEISKTPSERYLSVARAVQMWILANDEAACSLFVERLIERHGSEGAEQALREAMGRQPVEVPR